MRTPLIATSTVLLALTTYGTSCRGGKPIVEIEATAEPTSVLRDGSLVGVADVVTIDSGCATSTTRGQLRPSNLLFVLDRSGSMACNLPEDGQSSQSCGTFPVALFPDRPSKWDLTRNSVVQAISELRSAGTVRVGLMLFPKADSRCSVSDEPDIPIAPLDDAAEQNFVDTLSTVAPGGETPIAGATIMSYAHLLDRMRKGEVDGETFVIVVTDGYETCKTSEIPKLLGLDVPNARDLLFVRTFVIGVPGSDLGRAFLSEFAVAGATERDGNCTYGPAASDGNCHYDMTASLNFSTDLLDALTRINSEVMACTIDVPSARNGGPVNLQEVNVTVNGTNWSMVKGETCRGYDGWRYVNDFSSIQLCGEACHSAKQKGAAVTIILGCPTTIQ
ncbi:MAG TPA: vWA domain-containing protein [Polyangiaceae bacterium]